MNRTQAIEALAKLSGVSFVGITMETVVPLNGGKKNPHVGNVTKVVEVVGFVSSSMATYSNWINKRLASEGKEADFVAGERKNNLEWVEGHEGWLLDATPKSTGEYTEYMQIAILNTVSVPIYYYNGEVIAKADITGMKETRSEGKQGGIAEESKMVIRTPKLKSILALRAFKTETLAA